MGEASRPIPAPAGPGLEISTAQRIVPELLDTLRARMRILHRIRLLQPIGRRALAAEMGATERVLRAEVEFLRQQGLLTAGPAGMGLSEEGYALLDQLDPVLATLEGRTELAASLSRALGIARVTVVVGDSDEEPWVKDTLGLQAASLLREELTSGDVVAVTGGTTMATLARMMPRRGTHPDVRVVPARGGLGESASVQANTIAEQLAQAIGGSHTVLHVPDRLGEDTLEHLMAEPMVEARLREIRSATVVVHGIGSALEMARRRQLSEAEVALLRERRAVAEAFGYYFDQQGQPVYAMTTAGLKLADLDGVRLVMGVAGGHSKAEAIASAARAYRMDVLVTDEAAAKRILHAQSGTRAGR
ncbi:MAG: DNA-binding transcriptional regulator [Alicyclobacillus sp.]|nr:DNA-binding transcriptional regulator [Alicyclobacillus sp.]